MKESIAKTKLCPHNNAHKAVRDISMSVNTYCKGSDCMMWEAEQKQEHIKKEVEKEQNYRDYNKYNSDGFKFSHAIAGRGEGKPKVSTNIIIELRKYVDSDSGNCGLKTKELYCEGCN